MLPSNQWGSSIMIMYLLMWMSFYLFLVIVKDSNQPCRVLPSQGWLLCSFSLFRSRSQTQMGFIIQVICQKAIKKSWKITGKAKLNIKEVKTAVPPTDYYPELDTAKKVDDKETMYKFVYISRIIVILQCFLMIILWTGWILISLYMSDKFFIIMIKKPFHLMLWGQEGCLLKSKPLLMLIMPMIKSQTKQRNPDFPKNGTNYVIFQGWGHPVWESVAAGTFQIKKTDT